MNKCKNCGHGTGIMIYSGYAHYNNKEYSHICKEKYCRCANPEPELKKLSED